MNFIKYYRVIQEGLTKLSGRISFGSSAKKEIKVVVVANCQARPIAQLLPRLNPSIHVLETVIIHLAKSEEYDEYKPSFENADIIISQLVSDNYPCIFVRNGFLKKEYGSKVVTILNLYYSGYTPDWIYIRNLPGHGTLRGPMGDYHNQTVYDAWREGKNVQQAQDLICDVEYNKLRYGSIVHKSLLELKKREELVDIPICDFIEDNMFSQRLFFTCNHPSMTLLLEYVQRIMRAVGIEDLSGRGITELNEALDRFVPVVNCGVPFSFAQENRFKGVEILSINEQNVEIGRTKYYQLQELIQSFYRVYEVNSAVFKHE